MPTLRLWILAAITVLVCGLALVARGYEGFTSDHHAFLYVAAAILLCNTFAVGFLLLASAAPRRTSQKLVLFSLFGLSFAGAVFAGVQLWILFALSSAHPPW